MTWEERALEAGGHLSDDVAAVLLEYHNGTLEELHEKVRLAETLASDDPALD